MKAAVFRQVGTPMEIEDVVVDEPAGNEVLLRTAATGLCHSDLHCIEGSFEVERPIVLGHEASGIVEKVGSAVTNLEVGDHVIVFCTPGCGRCRACYSGRPTICHAPPFTRADGQPPRLVANGAPVGAHAGLGTFAELMLVGENSVVKIRKDMPLDKAALISCAVMTGGRCRGVHRACWGRRRRRGHRDRGRGAQRGAGGSACRCPADHRDRPAPEQSAAGQEARGHAPHRRHGG